MTDRELLEAAAKAAGMQHVMVWDASPPVRPTAYATLDKSVYWNPLTDDGDALRLAVKLSMRIYIYGGNDDDFTVVGSDQALPSVSGAREDHGNDPDAATRRAIVRAAALSADQPIGEQTK